MIRLAVEIAFLAFLVVAAGSWVGHTVGGGIGQAFERVAMLLPR